MIKESRFNQKIIRSEKASDKEVEDFNDYFQNQQQMEVKELEKNIEEEKVIDFFNSELSKELESLGLEPESISLDKIKFLGTDDYKKIQPNNSRGVFYDRSNIIIINIEHDDFKNKRLHLYKTLLHEMIHCLSFKKIGLKKITNDNFAFNIERTGYSLNKQEKLYGFDEGVVDLITLDVLQNNEEKLADLLNITEQEKSEFKNNIKIYNYSWFILGLAKKISKGNQQLEKEILTDVKRGEFTGNIMHLRKIEEFFGPKSLNVLSFLGLNKEKDELIFQFFNTTDEEEKDELIKNITKK